MVLTTSFKAFNILAIPSLAASSKIALRIAFATIPTIPLIRLVRFNWILICSELNGKQGNADILLLGSTVLNMSNILESSVFFAEPIVGTSAYFMPCSTSLLRTTPSSRLTLSILA